MHLLCHLYCIVMWQFSSCKGFSKIIGVIKTRKFIVHNNVEYSVRKEKDIDSDTHYLPLRSFSIYSPNQNNLPDSADLSLHTRECRVAMCASKRVHISWLWHYMHYLYIPMYTIRTLSDIPCSCMGYYNSDY